MPAWVVVLVVLFWVAWFGSLVYAIRNGRWLESRILGAVGAMIVEGWQRLSRRLRRSRA